MSTFNDYGLNEILLNSLRYLKYETPTEVQNLSIPEILEGNDILASAQTGTGKTGAFIIPILHNLFKNQNETALVIVPSRELAIQISTFAKQILWKSKTIKTALLIGGANMEKQIRELKNKARLIIGTPGRINDHIRQHNIHLQHCQYLVLDECDRMLDMGFEIQIKDIIQHIPRNKQTLLFSATLPKNIIKLANSYLKNPKRIAIGSLNAIADKVEQRIEKTNNKTGKLFELLESCGGTIIIFAKTQRGVENLHDKIKQKKYKTGMLHGGIKQNRRTQTIRLLKSSKFDILVATDVAARGLDISHVAYVINYDIPENPEDYVHRIGRTARANAEGVAISLIGKDELDKWANIQNFLNGETQEYIPIKNKRRRSTKKISSHNSFNKAKKRERKNYFSSPHSYESNNENKKKSPHNKSSQNSQQDGKQYKRNRANLKPENNPQHRNKSRSSFVNKEKV